MTTVVTTDMVVSFGTTLTYTVTPPENNPLYFTYQTLGQVGPSLFNHGTMQFNAGTAPLTLDVLARSFVLSHIRGH